MSVAPHSGIIDFGTFTPPTAEQDGIQGEVPAPLSVEVGYVLSTEGWIPADPGGAVDSVNGQIGVVVLTAADVGAATTAQGALADTAVQPGSLGTAAYVNTTTLATSAQGALADTAIQPADLGTAAYVDTSTLATSAQGALADTAIQPADLGSAAYQSTTAFATAAQGALADTAIQAADLGTAAYQNTTVFATAAQGTLADSAVQPGDLGSAAYDSSSAFATASQGALATTAIQPADLGTAAYQNTTAFATAAQGVLADSAVQPGSLGTAAYQNTTAFATALQGTEGATAYSWGDWSTQGFTTNNGVAAITKDMIGFIDRTTTTLAFDESTRTFTITPTGATWSVYYHGDLVTVTGARSIVIPNVSQAYFIRLNPSTLNLEAYGPIPDFKNDVIMAYIYWNAVTGEALIVGDERHGSDRDTTWHSNQHLNLGTVWRSGGALGYTLNDASAIQINVGTPLVIADEDLALTITNSATPTAAYEQILSPAASVEVVYLSGTLYTSIPASTTPWVAGVTTARYNPVVANSGSLADAGEGKFITYWVLATNDFRSPVKVVMGRTAWDNVDDAYGEQFEGYGLNFAEQVFMYQVVLQTSAAFANTPKVIIAAVRKIFDRVPTSTSTYAAGDHGNLTGRDSSDQHPIAAITGLQTALNAKQDTLVSGTNIKTVNGNSLLGSGNLVLGGSGTVTSVDATGGTGITVTGGPITSSGTLTITNTAPDQTVAISNGTGISVTGTYPNFTVTNTAPSPAGVVTSVGATTPITSTGGSTPVIAIPAASGTTDGYLDNADWTTFNNKQAALVSGTNIKTINGTSVLGSGDITTGTVTSVTGTAPVVSSGGTTPAISMAAATTSVSGYLTSTDWNTFNNKQPAGSYLTAVTADAPLSGSGTSGSHLVISQATTSTNGYLSSTDWNTFNNKQATLVSGTNIKTINGATVLGSGDLVVSGSFAGGTLTSPLILAAGTSTNGTEPLRMQSGTVVATPAAGTFEYDGVTTFSTPQAGNRGVVPSVHYITQVAAYTTPAGTANTLKQMFNATTNGTLTVLGNTTYFFECLFYLTAMSGTSGNFQFGIGGTAVFSNILYMAIANKTAITVQTASSHTLGTAKTAVVISASNTTTTGYAFIKGKFIVTTGGTIIPSYATSVAAASIVQPGSFFKCWEAGNNTEVEIGAWT